MPDAARGLSTRSSPPRLTPSAVANTAVVSTERVNHRNGYRHRDLDTRVGTIDVAVDETAPRCVLPRLAVRAPYAYRTSLIDCDRHVLPQRGFHPQNERPGSHVGYCQHVEIASLTHVRRT